MANTDAETLTALREARDSIIAGRVQSYAVNGQTYNRLRLDELEKLIISYEQRVARNRSSGGGMFGVASFRRPR